MNFPYHRLAFPYPLAVALCTLLLAVHAPAIAAPGAHGPNGEHLDGPTTMRATPTLPRVEAQSETFELVAQMRSNELAIVVDRYESNEPVLGAKLEVESGALKAVATFRAEQGDYVVADAAMLKALAAPGEHGLVFTLVAGTDSDLLDGTLVRAAGQAVTTGTKNDHGDTHTGGDHGHPHALERTVWIGAAFLALGLISSVAWWRRSRRDAVKSQGGL